MFYRLISRVYPKKVRESYTKLINYLGIKTNPDIYIGFTILIGLVVGIAGGFLMGMISHQIPVYLLMIGLFILTGILIYVPMMLKVEKTAKEIEVMLPDALQLMSSNLKSGLTVDQALLASVRPEFGSFTRELDRIGKEIAIGKPIEKALIDRKSVV